MCGRFIIEPDNEEHFFEHFGADLSRDLETLADAPAGVPEASADLFSAKPTNRPRFPRFNIAPTQLIPIIRSLASVEHKGDKSRRVISMAHWGLIPSWAKDRTMASRMINARSETAAEKPSFRTALSRRRCIVPATGFYEWKAVDGRKAKQPYLISRADRKPLAFAGLWETWTDRENGSRLESCTILTTAANRFMSQIHDRMPVILLDKDFGNWLDPDGGSDHAQAMFRQAEPHELVAVAVSTKVSSVKNNGPDCRDPDPTAPQLEDC